MIFGISLKLALVCGNGAHFFLLKSCAIHNEIWLGDMFQVRAKIVEESARVVWLARNCALGQLGVKARVNANFGQRQMIRVRVEWVRHKHNVD